MKGIRLGWIHLATGAGLGRIFGFVSNLLLSRWLGPTELGLFNLVTTTVQISDTLVRCGGDYGLNYELGGKPDPTQTIRGAQLAQGFAQICSFATAIICVGVAIWVWFGQGLLPTEMSSSQRRLMTLLLVFMIACEGISASAWEVLLVSHRTSTLALRQGLFVPLRLFVASASAIWGGVVGAMAGWSLVALFQGLWLRFLLGNQWKPLQARTILWAEVRTLLKRGLPFYGGNLSSTLIFYPLLLMVASASGLAEVGYLRVGQILQQLFAFLPATLVPVLFLKLRTEETFERQAQFLLKPLRYIWIALLSVVLFYCLLDRPIIDLLFGQDFSHAISPTRILVLTAFLESIAQLVLQPVLATGQAGKYSIWQNISALIAGLLGYFLISKIGLMGFLLSRFTYVAIPLIRFGLLILSTVNGWRNVVHLIIITILLSASIILQSIGLLNDKALESIIAILIVVLFLSDRSLIPKAFKRAASCVRTD